MKISNRLKKIIKYSVIIFVLFAAGFVAYGQKLNEQQGEYTTYNTADKGTKALYLLAERMNFLVERTIRPSRFLPDNATVVLINPDASRLNSKLELKYLKQWLSRGNVLVVSLNKTDLESHGIYSLIPPGNEFEMEDGLLNSASGKGRVIILEEPEKYTNKGLADITPGIAFINALDRAGKERIVFNEYYHGLGHEGYSFWDIAGPTGRLITLQLLMGLLIMLLISSVRFGKAAEVFEITKRMENENLFALSNLYMKSKSNSLVLNIYLTELKKDISKFLGFSEIHEEPEILKAAESNIALKDFDLGQLFNECRNYTDTNCKNNRKLKKLVRNIEEIRKVMR